MPTASLVTALVGLCVPFLGPILGIVFGLIGLSKGRAPGRGRALAGTIVGGVGLVAHIVAALMIVAGIAAAVDYVERMARAAEEFRPAIEALERDDLDTAATLLAAKSNLTEDEIKARVFAAHEELGEVERTELARRDHSRSTGPNDVRVSLTWNLHGKRGDGNVTLDLHYDGQRWTMQDLRFKPGTVAVEIGRESFDD